MKSRSGVFVLILALTLAAMVSGCATKKYVDAEVGMSEQRTGERVDDVSSQVEENQTRLAEQEEQLAQLSMTSREALERALAAGILAEGKFLYETLLTDEKVRFGFESAELGTGAKEALDVFSADLRSRDENVYIEIQGHTDSTGPDDYNLELGTARAEAVRRYLNMRHGVPLNRLGVVSYGEEVPIADNSTREGRSLNRRVVLVVLK